MTRRIVISAAALLLSLAGGPAREAAAQTQTWNQEVVTALAGELEDAVSGLREVIRGNPTKDRPGQRRQIYEILDNLRLIEQSATSMHAALKQGAGLEETLPTYNRLQQIRRDTEVLAQRVDISAITKPKLDRARDILAKLEPFYPAQPKIENLK